MFIILSWFQGNGADAYIVQDEDNDEGAGNKLFGTYSEAEAYAEKNCTGFWKVVNLS